MRAEAWLSRSLLCKYDLSYWVLEQHFSCMVASQFHPGVVCSHMLQALMGWASVRAGAHLRSTGLYHHGHTPAPISWCTGRWKPVTIAI